MDARDTLDALGNEPAAWERLVHQEVLAARAAQYGETAEPFHIDVEARLRSRRIEQLYTHQAHGIDALRDGRSVVLATGTASGKSLCYQVPIVESVVTERRDTALLIFPTKALAQDQLAELHGLLGEGERAGDQRLGA